MPNRTPPGPPSRVRSLDGLRGVAAVTVVVGHVLLLLDGSRSSQARHAAESAMSTEGTILYALWNGRGAVLIFFALSGFVLTLPFASTSTPFSGSYFAKRWARIGIPFVVMTTVAMTSSVWLSQLHSQSTWPAIMFDRPPSIGDVIEWGTLIGLPNVSAFNSVVWTLVVEIRLSMLLPLVIASHRRFGLAPTLAGTLLIAVIADLFAVAQPYQGSMAASISVAGTLHFLPLFAAGSALALGRERLANIAWLGRRVMLLGLLASSLVLYVRGHTWAVNIATPSGLPSAQPMLVEDYIVGFSAVLLVGLVSAGVGATLLASRPLLALGAASYSLYLWHLPLLVGCALVFAPRIGIEAATAVGVAVTAVITWLSYSLVEAPVQRVIRGRRPAEAVASAGQPAKVKTPLTSV